ncbi:MAG: DNA transformation protein [Paraglaciecola psychrophila]|jgi:DNA transformation protein
MFLEVLMFARMFENISYLKIDINIRQNFDALSLPPFPYLRGSEKIALSYYQTPDEALDDTEMRLV